MFFSITAICSLTSEDSFESVLIIALESDDVSLNDGATCELAFCSSVSFIKSLSGTLTSGDVEREAGFFLPVVGYLSLLL